MQEMTVKINSLWIGEWCCRSVRQAIPRNLLNLCNGSLTIFNSNCWTNDQLKTKKFRSKRARVLDRGKFRFREALSNISGYDIESHNGYPETALRRAQTGFGDLRKTHPCQVPTFFGRNKISLKETFTILLSMKR